MTDLTAKLLESDRLAQLDKGELIAMNARQNSFIEQLTEQLDELIASRLRLETQADARERDVQCLRVANEILACKVAKLERRAHLTLIDGAKVPALLRKQAE